MSQNRTLLKAIMQDEGRRQSWLAQRIGKNQSEVSRYVNRGMLPDEETRQAIAEALCRNLDELWPDLMPVEDRTAA